MDSTSIGMTVALVILVAMSAYFSATETAFTSLNRIRLKSRADNGDQRAARALALAEDYDKLLSTILIGNNIVNNVATTIGAVLFIRLLDDVRGPTVSAIVLTVVILIFGEVSPKSLAKESPEAWAMLSAPLLRAFVAVLTPANFLFTQWKRLLSLIIHKREEDGITEEELVTMVDQAENEGGLDEHESELIRNAIEFHDLEVSEILTPRVDIVAAEENSTMEEVGSQGAVTAAGEIAPDYAVALDVSFAVTPDVPARNCGKMGGGVMLGIAPILDNEETDRVRRVAKEQELPLQFEVMGGSTGTDADCIAASGSGVRTVLFSIPQKYMHTPVETVAPEDVKATAELLCAYITDLARDLAKEGN